MTEYGITETDEITVEAVGNLFNNSPLSNMTKYSNLADGTIGLAYSGSQWKGLGTVGEDVKDIYVASIVDGVVITSAAEWLINSNSSERTIYLPDSITEIKNGAFVQSSNKKIVFGVDFVKIGSHFSQSAKNMLLDFRKCKNIVTLGGNYFNGSATTTNNAMVLVRDEQYDLYATATNWTAVIHIFIKESDWIAQGGSV
jgi:hypothetical protein